MFNFSAAIFFLLITPGPGVLSAAGVGAAFGLRAGWRYILGLAIGNNLVALAVITGLAAIVFASPMIRTILMFASTAYLFYIAIRIALAGSEIGFIRAQGYPNIKDGILLQLINPKAYAVSTFLFSGFPIMEGSYLMEVSLKLFIFNLIWFPIHILWVWFGASIRKLDLPARTQRIINFAMAGALLIVVILAFWSIQ